MKLRVGKIISLHYNIIKQRNEESFIDMKFLGMSLMYRQAETISVVGESVYDDSFFPILLYLLYLSLQWKKSKHFIVGLLEKSMVGLRSLDTVLKPEIITQVGSCS